jgi:hypothetical protein
MVNNFVCNLVYQFPPLIRLRAAFETERSGGMGVQNPIQGLNQRMRLFFIANRNRTVIAVDDKAFRRGNLAQRRSEQAARNDLGRA